MSPATEKFDFLIPMFFSAGHLFETHLAEGTISPDVARRYVSDPKVLAAVNRAAQRIDDYVQHRYPLDKSQSKEDEA